MPDGNALALASRRYAEQVRGGVVLSTYNLAEHLDQVAEALARWEAREQATPNAAGGACPSEATVSTEPLSGRPAAALGVRLREIEALPSTLRTPEQMKWIHDRFKIDGLERLSRSETDYYESHGHYLPDVAALAHAALVALEQERERALMIEGYSEETQRALERVTAERNDALGIREGFISPIQKVIELRDALAAAVAESERLAAALKEIGAYSCYGTPWDCYVALKRIAGEALAGGAAAPPPEPTP